MTSYLLNRSPRGGRQNYLRFGYSGSPSRVQSDAQQDGRSGTSDVIDLTHLVSLFSGANVE